MFKVPAPIHGTRSGSVRVLLVALLCGCGCILSARQGWRDPSRHDVRLVTVDQGVQLEILDWGGSGPAVVLLTGHYVFLTRESDVLREIRAFVVSVRR